MKLLITLLTLVFATPTMAATTTVPNPFGFGGYTHGGPTIIKVAKSGKRKAIRVRSVRVRESSSQSCDNLPTVCYAMSSCAQAQAAYRCGNTRLDRDKDGIPCDNLCQ